MTAPSIVRIAGPKDHHEIWRLFLSGHRENGRFALAPEKVDWFIWRALRPDDIPPWDSGPRGVIGVIGEVGRLEGLVFVNLGSFWYTHDRHLEEYIVYVDPECRRSFHARALINWMTDRAESIHLPLLTGVLSDVRTEAKCALYRRMLPKMGEFFFYDPRPATAASSMAVA